MQIACAGSNVSTPRTGRTSSGVSGHVPIFLSADGTSTGHWPFSLAPPLQESFLPGRAQCGGPMAFYALLRWRVLLAPDRTASSASRCCGHEVPCYRWALG